MLCCVPVNSHRVAGQFSQGLLELHPPYARHRSTHYCKTCTTYFYYEPPKDAKPRRERMSLEEAFTEGKMPLCSHCGSRDAVIRMVHHRPPYHSPILMLRGSGQGTGLAALAVKGLVKVPPSWPCVDEDERKCTHFCKECKLPFRELRPPTRPDPPQVRRDAVGLLLALPCLCIASAVRLLNCLPRALCCVLYEHAGVSSAA